MLARYGTIVYTSVYELSTLGKRETPGLTLIFDLQNPPWKIWPEIDVAGYDQPPYKTPPYGTWNHFHILGRCTCSEYFWHDHICPYKEAMSTFDRYGTCQCCPYCIKECADGI